MKKILVFFVLFCFINAFSQQKAGNTHSDINKDSQNRSENYKTEISGLIDILQKARKTGDKVSEIQSLSKIASFYSDNDKEIESLKYYMQALVKAKETNNALATATISKDIGTVYVRYGKAGQAIPYQSEAKAAAQQLGNEMLAAEATAGLGSAKEQLRKLDEALESYSQALAIYRARGDELQAGNMLSKMANAYRKQGDFPQSILNYKEALGYFNTANERNRVADVLNSIGGVLALMGDHNESLRLYEQAYLDAVAIDHEPVVISASLGMANAYENLRQYPESIRYHKIYEQKKDAFDKKNAALAVARIKESIPQQSSAILGKNDNQQTVAGLSGKDFTLYGLISAGLLLFFIVLILLWRKRILNKTREDNMFNEAEGQERLRMVQNLHNDLDSKLTEINSLSESIVERATGMPTIRIQGEAMQETTKKIEENIRDLVWLLTPKTTTLTNYVGSIKEYVNEFFEDSPVEVLLSAPEGVSATVITKESQLGLLSVIKESLALVKADPNATKVFFGIIYTGTRLMVSIKDNGKGAERSDADKKYLENQLHSTGGIMRMDCDPGWGTTIKIIIPVDKTVRKSKSPLLNFFSYF